MKTKKILISITFTGFLFLLLVSFVKAPKNDYITVQQKKWVAPASADKIVNPLKGDANAATSGKKLYKVMCFVCHGPKGKGDGMAGAGLTPKPTDLTSDEFQSQSDGAIFWKIAEGRAPMASYKSSIPEKKRWEIINYIRTLK
ncbi:Cytochrome C oxidase, cbb3-type, subunit III [Flaviramulus basaltis]|uniref:Cytochrome C oxidase, cbb3-type, subunit III n=1 Tax=Flaviramulus basaltis TaxID=369401 RepID=A0A1K2IQT3_9FLAO|nr:cytochrome c [Flaviramulus basaltis]SFZ94793.1 Cytochrome C oxidase, cbb3-type, subunit III [Flaviramulus basaltis]